MYDLKLDTFIQVVRDGSFSKAAEHLFISSVSVMKQMNSLEEMVGVRLLDRTTQGISLTKPGEFFYDAAIDYISKSESILKQTREMNNKGKKVVRIGTSLLRSAQPLIRLWSNMEDKNDYQIDLVSFEDDPLSMQRMFTNIGTKIDFFVGPINSEQIKHGPYQTYELPETKAYWGVPINNHLADKDEISMSDLKNDKVLLVKRGLSPRLDALRNKLEENNIFIVDSDDFYDINTFNICSQNNYIMETLDIWKDVYAPIKAIEMDKSYRMPYGIVFSNEASDSVKKFIDKIGTEYNKKKGVLTLS